MASRQSTVDYIVDQMAGAGIVSARRMFGEYGLYLDGKLVGLICDDMLFVKETKAGAAMAGDISRVPPYPGAKPSILVPDERWDDADWLMALIRVTAADLPAAKRK
jgi:DNA transformation protein and related proteins